MSAPRVEMHRLQELVRLYRLGTGVRERARLLRMSTRTEREYREAIAAAGLLEGDAGELPEGAELQAAVEALKPPAPTGEVATTVDRWMPAIRAGVARGAGPTAIWDKLHRTEPEFQASLSAVKRAVVRIRIERGVDPNDVVIPVETGPGEVAQVDFGFAGWFLDSATGKLRKAWLFVMVLCYSRHMYAKLVYNQKATTWVSLHVEAFRWFGGVPRTVVPDNLKAAVVRAAFGVCDRHELALNRTYREVARHYGFMIDPTPIASPEKKGKAESGVKYGQRNYLLAGGFETVDEANTQLPDWLLLTAGRRIHGTTRRRPLDMFAEEIDSLLSLPDKDYEIIEWKEATVHRDCHVEFDRRLYSVPWPYCGSRVWVKANPTTVMIYANENRLATHDRNGPGRRSTNPAHLPKDRAYLAQRSLQWWVEKADRLDPSIGTYVRNVIGSDTALSKLRDIQAIVSYLEKFPLRRAVATCRRADYYGNYTYQGVRRILTDALDVVPLPSEQPELHGQLADPRFARTPSELAQCVGGD